MLAGFCDSAEARPDVMTGFCDSAMTFCPMKVHLLEIPSTNTWMLDALAQGEPIEEKTVAYTLRQTQGRGQMGNSWESETGQNIAFSLLLRPLFLPVTRQFLLSEVCCLGVLDGIRSLCHRSERGADFCRQLCIKWPNDIYLGDDKLGGILIENRLFGSSLAECVLGVGLNVNQTMWQGNAPNPTSLRLHGWSFSPEEVLDAVSEGIVRRYELLREDLLGYASQLHDDFMSNLYRRHGFHPYVDAQTQEPFEAIVEGIDPQGPLLMALKNGERRRYWFKEIRFVLPCGVVKE